MDEAAAKLHPFEDSEEVFRGQMPSDLAEREAMIGRVLSSLEEAGCSPDPFFDRLFLDEIISNAILHGNRRDPGKTITVRAFASGDRFGFEVGDEGAGFDWGRALSRAREPEDLTRECGRGLALVLAKGAELHFLEGGRRVVVVRRKSTVDS